MFVARVYCMVLAFTILGVFAFALARPIPVRRAFAGLAVLLVLLRVGTFWMLLFNGATGDRWAHPVGQDLLLFPEWIAYARMSGTMGRLLAGTALIMVGSFFWAGLMAVGIGWIRRKRRAPPGATA